MSTAQTTPKIVPDTEFSTLLDDTLPNLTVAQLDKLWERMRLEVRRRYYNQGIEGALKILDQELGLASPTRNAVAKKLWAAKGKAPRTTSKKAAPKKATKTTKKA